MLLKSAVVGATLLSLVSAAHNAFAGAPEGVEGQMIWDDATLPIAASTEATEVTVVANTYIVQLQTEEVGLSGRSFGSHKTFRSLSKKAELDYSLRQVYSDASIFVGVSLTLANDADVEALKSLDNVIGVWPVQAIPRPLAAIPFTENALESRQNANVTTTYVTGDIDVNKPHKMAGVDKLHALGIKGKGIKIAIIDTGVDYRHPSLGGGFGPGYKIEFGYDFVEDKADPLVTCVSGGHGTHVSGIIGMVDAPGTGFGLIGVAPEATLGMYRVFQCTGSAYTDDILAALVQAGVDKVDVVSMSLGAIVQQESRDPFAIATTALADQGIAVIAANGNNGAYGLYYTSAPGLGFGAFSVGSTDNANFPTTYKLKDSNGRSLRYSSVLPLDGPSDGLTVQVMNDGGSSTELTGCYTSYYAAAAANLTAQGIDPATVILTIKEGGCSSLAKGQVAAQYGYKYVLTYITSELSISLQAYGDMSPGVSTVRPVELNVADSTTVLNSYQKKPGQYKIFFDATDYDAKSPPILTGGFMSNYSSFGPSFALNINPKLSAPGGQILATWPLDLDGGYSVISGTSMATPFMSGCYALIKSQYPNLGVRELYALLANSGDPMPWFYNPSMLSTAVHQGGGAVNVFNALHWESLVTPYYLNIGAFNNTQTANVTIKNRSTRSKIYTLSHKPTAGMQEATTAAWQYGMQYPWYASVAFPTPTITIKGGESAVVKFEIAPPVEPTSSIAYPIYAGYIVVSNNYEDYTIPYAGSNFYDPYDWS